MSRSRRSKSQANAVAEGLSVLDKLILSQAVWEVGPSSWLKISRILGKHSLLSHPKTFFTAQSCHAMYNYMMKEAGFELFVPYLNRCVLAPVHLKLAEKYHTERVEELRTLIQAEEQQFKAIVAEIAQIRAGQKDKELEATITGSLAPEAPDESLDVAPEDTIPEVEMSPAAAEPETIQKESNPTKEQSPTNDSDLSPPGPEIVMEDIQTAPPEVTKLSVEASPPPETPSSPVKEQGSLIHTLNDENSQDVEVLKPAPEKQAVDAIPEAVPETVVPIQSAEPTAEDVKAESTDVQNDEEDAGPSQSKPASKHSEAFSESTPAPTLKEATPAADETQLDEEIPLSAAMRRREGILFLFMWIYFFMRVGKRKASFFGGLDSPRERKRAREDSEPVDDDEQGSSSAVLRRRGTGRTEEQVALKRFQTVITMVHSQISQHRNGNIFHNPIKTSEAPDYHDIVKRPIDLKTIKAKIKDGVIGNSLEYQRDIYLMFANAMMYNRPGSDVHTMAEDMMVESDSHINTFRQTEGYVREGYVRGSRA
ncbi:hypothetical protein GGX14DRAFT_345637 [Mycena pura]|uniref:Bromo domain-containing protein n=1 Tax=Mycena pura TaxID=153505 RepID=A0AAD6YTP6_9AGAR|nr:hypothetical protein GGX14DRAFT_345637 [Mycena pura]